MMSAKLFDVYTTPLVTVPLTQLISTVIMFWATPSLLLVQTSYQYGRQRHFLPSRSTWDGFTLFPRQTDRQPVIGLGLELQING